MCIRDSSLTHSIFTIGLFSNRWLVAGIALMVALQLVFTYAPLLQGIFHTTPIDFADWGLAVFAGIVTFVIVEIEKHLFRPTPVAS